MTKNELLSSKLQRMNPDLEDLRNEVLRKIGRNVLLFQEFEVILKLQQRNELIHHFPLNFKLNTIEGLRDAEQYLDSQRENMLPGYKNVQQNLKILDKLRKEAAKYIVSDEFLKEFKLDKIRKENVVKLLIQITEVAKRNDGWTLVEHAGNLLHKHAPGQLKEVKKKYKCRTLKDFILKTEIFDLSEEATPKSGKRALYRLKDGWKLETNPAN